MTKVNAKKFEVNFGLFHPDTGALVGVFQGYSDTGSEIWLTGEGIEHCNFEGFEPDGYVMWSQSKETFIETVREKK